MAKFCGKCGREMADIDRVCGYCGTPANRYEVLPDDLPQMPELPVIAPEKTAVSDPEPPARVEPVPADDRTIVYDRPEQRSDTRRIPPQPVTELPQEEYIPSDAQRRSRSYTIEDVPAVSAQQRSSHLILILSIIAVVLIAVGAFIFFVFRPFDDKTNTNGAEPTEPSTEYVTEA